MLFDLERYRLRKLDPAQGTKPLDFGGGGINGSINLDGRFIAINSYHPEHGIVTLTSVPPFPDADRYDQAKVRAYRKSLVTNDGFGLTFEQEIIEREYYLIEDAVPFLRFTLADGTIAECVTTVKGITDEAKDGQFPPKPKQIWRFSRAGVKAHWIGSVSVMRSAYSQLTEGGVLPFPSAITKIAHQSDNYVYLVNEAIHCDVNIYSPYLVSTEADNGSVELRSSESTIASSEYVLRFTFGSGFNNRVSENPLSLAGYHKSKGTWDTSLVISRARAYSFLCELRNGCNITDHMILPLLWTRDSYYVLRAMSDVHPRRLVAMRSHIEWLFRSAWRGTICKARRVPLSYAWGRAYVANGMPKDNNAFQLDQQIYPFLELVEYVELTQDVEFVRQFVSDVERLIHLLRNEISNVMNIGLYPTDETPADDDIPMNYHFSSHILLWFTLGKLEGIFKPLMSNKLAGVFGIMRDYILKRLHMFITEYGGKQIYAYAISGDDSRQNKHYIYHDANDIPLVMMPLWGFCDKDDLIWRNTIDFAFSDANPGFYDGVLGSVHTPAPWALGDAQELIFCKVIGDRDRYQRVWERVEKAAQWDGALPEAYNVETYEVVSRHWFAWPNAMIAIADGISWDWETEGEYAR